MKYESLPVDAELRRDDLVVFVYESKNGNVKRKCGVHYAYTVLDEDGERFSVLADGVAPELQGFRIASVQRPVREYEDVRIDFESGEVLRE